MEPPAVGALRLDLAARALEIGVVETRHERRQKGVDGLVAEVREQGADVRADQLSSVRTEVSSAHLVAVANDAVEIDGKERVGNAVEKGLEWRLCLGQERLREGRFHLLVVPLDQFQQRDEVGLRDPRLLSCRPDFFP